MSFFRNSTCTRTQYGVFSNQHIPTHHGLIYCTLFNTYLHLLYTFVIKNLFRQWGSLKPVTKLPWKSSNHKYNRFILSTMLFNCPVKFTHYNNHLCTYICFQKCRPVYINCIEIVVQKKFNDFLPGSYIKFQFNCSIKCMHIKN